MGQIYYTFFWHITCKEKGGGGQDIIQHYTSALYLVYKVLYLRSRSLLQASGVVRTPELSEKLGYFLLK